MKYVKTFEEFVEEIRPSDNVTEAKETKFKFKNNSGKVMVFNAKTIDDAKKQAIKYFKTEFVFPVKNVDESVSEDEVTNAEDKPEQEVSLTEELYETIKKMYQEACAYEEDENPTHTMEGYMKEGITMMVEMFTRVLKENSDICKVAAKAAMKKTNEKDNDENVVSDRTYEYVNDMMKSMQEACSEKMEEMMQENSDIAMIAAKALSKEKMGNPDANNY